MSFCDQNTINDDIFNYITNITKLNIQGCLQLNGKNLNKLIKLKYINIKFCDDIIDNYLNYFKNNDIKVIKS
jgi:hypothetical protein